MSNKIVINSANTGRTAGAAGGFYAVIYNQDGAVYNVTTASTFTAIGSITWTNADLQMSEQGSNTGQYQATFPSTIPRGLYTIEIREQFGSSPSVVNDKPVAPGSTYYWDTLMLLDPAVGPMAKEDYAADGAQPTMSEMQYMQFALRQAVVTGTSFKAKKLDGTTDAMVFTLDSATNPTSMTRTS